MSADYPAAGSVLPFVESVSAHVFCRSCDFNRVAPDAYRPFSFLWTPTGAPCCRRLREWPEHERILTELRAEMLAGLPGAGKSVEKALSALGMNKLYYAFDPKYIPHVVPTNVALQDLLHLFFDGLTRHELAWLFYVFFKLGLDRDVVNEAIKK